MSESGSGDLPTYPVTQEQRVILVESLSVTWKVLDHLREKGVIPAEEPTLRARAGCCKPDGGTCCVNKQPVVEG